MAVRKKTTTKDDTHLTVSTSRVSKGYSKKLYPHGLYFIKECATPEEAKVLYDSFGESKVDNGAICYLQAMVDGYPTIVKQKFLVKP